MDNRYNRHNRRKYNLKVHIVLVTKYRKQLLLIGYDTTDRVCDIVKVIKQQTTYHLWQKYSNFLSKQYWKKKIFWSDGYFACSIGEVSSATIQKYIESQGNWLQIHKAPPTA